MKGIYLTKEGKEEIENIITNLKNTAPHQDGVYISEKQYAVIDLFEDILSSAVVLPVAENWEFVKSFINSTPISEILADGVIIQSNNLNVKK